MSEARSMSVWVEESFFKVQFLLLQLPAHSESLKRHIAAGEEKNNFTWPGLTFSPSVTEWHRGGKESVVPVSALNTEPSVHWTSDRYISRIRLVFCTPADFSLQPDEPWLSHVCSRVSLIQFEAVKDTEPWEQSWWCDTGPHLKRWKCFYCA